MSMAQIAGKTAFLPMEPYEVEKFLYDLGLDEPGVKHGFEFVDGFYDDYRIDWGTDFRLANRLTYRIGDMGDRREDFRAWCCAQEHCTAADALRASYNMRSFTFFPDMDTDEALGEFALDNNFFEDYNALPTEIYEALDREKAGARMREQEGGVFADGGYLVVLEDFSQEPLPAEEPLTYFQVRFSDEHHDSGWCDVPLSEDNVLLIARAVGSEDLSGLPVENRSIIPYLNGMISGADELPELGLLSEALDDLSDEGILKYQALLEVVQPGTPSTALRLAYEIGHYEVTPEYADPAHYGLQHAAYTYSLDADCSLLDYVDLAGYGTEMLRAEGYEATRYGAVYRNVIAQKFLAGPNTVYSGDCYCGRTEGFPTCVCWDPDTEKVWLELNDFAADSEMSESFAYYQGICETWGIRHCASREYYEQIIEDLGAQPYDEVMAEEQDQEFYEMGGMA